MNSGGQRNKFNNNSSLMLSYYNLAVQQEFLRREIDSKISYSYCEGLAQKESKLNNNQSDNPLFKKLKKRENYLKTAETNESKVSKKKYQNEIKKSISVVKPGSVK